MRGIPATKSIHLIQDDKLLSTHHTLRTLANCHPEIFSNYEQVRNVARQKIKNKKFETIRIERY
jgi:hypothetical protein